MTPWHPIIIDPAIREIDRTPIDELAPARGIIKAAAMGVVGAGLLALAVWCLLS